MCDTPVCSKSLKQRESFRIISVCTAKSKVLKNSNLASLMLCRPAFYSLHKISQTSFYNTIIFHVLTSVLELLDSNTASSYYIILDLPTPVRNRLRRLRIPYRSRTI